MSTPVASDFVHLHCHTEYSLLDGAIRLPDMVKRAASFGMGATAITDHGNMYGALRFYDTCKKGGIKPIIGCEVYVTPDHEDRSSEKARQRFHLVLLAQNLTGYHNLVRLVSRSHTHGMYYRPRVDKRLLAQYSEGLICLSACLAGEVPRALEQSASLDEAIRISREYASIFPERFYLELQSNGLKEQEIANTKLIELADHLKLPLVATNDCHYLDASDVEAHDILLCIQTQKTVLDKDRMRFGTTELYYKSPEEMAAAFADVPEAISNTARIADQCDLNLKFDNYIFPLYALPEGMSAQDEFIRLAREGLERRLEKHPKRDEIDADMYRERLEYEIKVICDMEFPAYFLIVQDFINWAKDNAIPVGPGRGSAAGSLVAWSLRITNLDPIPYSLLFERFLNIERISMPDIDVDFCERRRGEVIRYVGEHYGHDKVAQISTFGKMKAKAVVRDVGRALGLSFAETNNIAKLVPASLDMTLRKALEQEPRLADMYKDDPSIRRLLDISMRLEGLSRHASTHAAGVVVSDKPMTEYLPLYKGKREEIVTQFDMKMVEKVGLVKFDFLGLRTMTLIQDTLDLIEAGGQTPPDLDTMALDDPEVYALYSRGDTDGIFQVESSGMRQYLRQLKPSCFDDLIAMLALYRPGPLGSGMVEDFIKRKHGESEVTYPLPQLEPCLRDTYGVIVYQEQVMQIAQVVASYTLGGADLLRRAMGKKNKEEMQQERAKFLAGAKANNHELKKAGEIFDLMEKFAEYGFNKSHSAAYALISYYTAYLKVYHPVQFMAALLSSEMGNQDKLLKYVAACRDMGITVMPPNVQLSRWFFSVHEGAVVFGLGGVKNAGEEAIKALIEVREEEGPFTSLYDLCSRVSTRRVNKRVLESLIKCGACDCLGVSRAAMMASLDAVVARAQKKSKEKNSNQVSLFSIVPQEEPIMPGIGFECPEQDAEEWPDDQKLQAEKEALGFFLTSHPLQPFRRALLENRLTPLEEIREREPGEPVRTAVLVTSVKTIYTKKGDPMAFAQIEDLTASGECLIFPKLFPKVRDLLESDKPLYLKATIAKEDGDRTNDKNDQENDPSGMGAVEGDEDVFREIKLLAEEITPLTDVCYSSDMPFHVYLEAKHATPERIEGLKTIFSRHKGKCGVSVHLNLGQIDCLLTLGGKWNVQPGPQLETDIQRWMAAK